MSDHHTSFGNADPTTERERMKAAIHRLEDAVYGDGADDGEDAEEEAEEEEDGEGYPVPLGSAEYDSKADLREELEEEHGVEPEELAGTLSDGGIGQRDLAVAAALARQMDTVDPAQVVARQREWAEAQ